MSRNPGKYCESRVNSSSLVHADDQVHNGIDERVDTGDDNPVQDEVYGEVDKPVWDQMYSVFDEVYSQLWDEKRHAQ